MLKTNFFITPLQVINYRKKKKKHGKKKNIPRSYLYKGIIFITFAFGQIA